MPPAPEKGCLTKLSDTTAECDAIYFEKPRTTVGWKGLINDPPLDDNLDIQQGHTQSSANAY